MKFSLETETAETNKRESTEPVSDDDPKRTKLDVEVRFSIYFSKLAIITMEQIDMKNSSKSQLQFKSLCSIEIIAS